ncbi:LCP family protein [candidate division WWE3 bacterium]|nr:LCP family protein [candidate division WWE3 bacterium]
MKYRSYSNKQAVRTNRNTDSSHKPVLWKAVLVISLIAVVLFGVKLLVTPIVSVIAGLVKDSSDSISFFANPQKIKETNGVTNILLIGVDERAKGGSSLTDTMIVASYRHSDNRLVLLSFPRDLWVKVPKFDGVNEFYTKINGVYTTGEDNGYSSSDGGLGGGVGLLAKVLQDYAGVPIHYYAKINFNGFQKAIDEVGGVDVYVENTFTDYEYPKMGYENAPWETRWEVLNFKQGWQHMDGTTALKYARSRHAYGPEGSDFARARRQQKVILALKERIVSNQTLFNPTRLQNLYMALSSEFDTNISLNELPIFYDLFKEIGGDFSTVKTYVLSNGDDEAGILYNPDPSQYGGAYVLIPKDGWQAFKEFIDTILFSEEALTPTPTSEDTE